MANQNEVEIGSRRAERKGRGECDARFSVAIALSLFGFWLGRARKRFGESWCGRKLAKVGPRDEMRRSRVGESRAGWLASERWLARAVERESTREREKERERERARARERER